MVVKCVIFALLRQLHRISLSDGKIVKTVCKDKMKRVSEVFLKQVELIKRYFQRHMYACTDRQEAFAK